MRADMAKLTRHYKGTRTDKDRHGNRRWYTLDPTGRKVRMREEPGSDAWVREWESIRSGVHIADDRVPMGSMARLIVDYMASPEWAALATSTKANRRRILDKVRASAGDLAARSITPADIRAGRNARQDTPAAANVHMKVLSALFSWGQEHGHVDHNPVRGVKRLAMRSGGFHTWTADECLQFEAAHPVGTRARAAYALALYTGSRLSDVARLGPADVFADGIRLTQQKTGSQGTVPMLGELREALEALDMTGLQTFLVTQYGRPFTAKGLGNWFADRCREAGLPDECRMHGLRKAIAARLAEAGATTEEIMAVTLHMSESEVRTYVREADQKRLARNAMGKLKRPT